MFSLTGSFSDTVLSAALLRLLNSSGRIFSEPLKLKSVWLSMLFGLALYKIYKAKLMQTITANLRNCLDLNTSCRIMVKIWKSKKIKTTSETNYVKPQLNLQLYIHMQNLSIRSSVAWEHVSVSHEIRFTWNTGCWGGGGDSPPKIFLVGLVYTPPPLFTAKYTCLMTTRKNLKEISAMRTALPKAY